MKLAPKGQEFVFCNGLTAKSLGQLAHHVKKLSPEEFSHHMNEERNDFHSWLSECVSAEAAEVVKEANNQREVVEKLAGHHWENEHRKRFGY